MDTRDSMLNEFGIGYGNKIKRYFASFFPSKRDDLLQLLYTTLCFFFIIGAYTLAKELKDIVFTEIVGKEYIGQAKIITIFLLIPSVMLYAKFVDALHRYQLLALYGFIYGAFGLLFAFLLGHHSIGLPNAVGNPYRLFGWLFYFFVEGYSPFVVSVFWAFVNSTSSPEGAKKNYATMVSGSKIGGMLTAGFAWWLLSVTDVNSIWMLSHVTRIQVLLAVSSGLLLMVPIAIYYMIKSVPHYYLHGYKAAYLVEKEREKKGYHAGIVSGLNMLMRYPYVFGIFCFVFFYEIIHTVLSYQRIRIAKEGATNLSDFSAFFFKIIFITHCIGFLISFIGTRALLEKLGEKICLLLIPISTALLFIYFKLSGTQFAFLSFFVILRSIHYAFSYPVRESLYILTVKEIQFKSKSWIDAFGSKIAKAGGSSFNWMTGGLAAVPFALAQSILFSFLIGIWIVVAFLLGKRFEKAAANNEVIGLHEGENH